MHLTASTSTKAADRVGCTKPFDDIENDSKCLVEASSFRAKHTIGSARGKIVMDTSVNLGTQTMLPV